MNLNKVAVGSGIGFTTFCALGLLDAILFNSIQPWYYILTNLLVIGVGILSMTYLGIIDRNHRRISFALAITTASLLEFGLRFVSTGSYQEANVMQILVFTIVFALMTFYSYNGIESTTST